MLLRGTKQVKETRLVGRLRPLSGGARFWLKAKGITISQDRKNAEYQSGCNICSEACLKRTAIVVPPERGAYDAPLPISFGSSCQLNADCEGERPRRTQAMRKRNSFRMAGPTCRPGADQHPLPLSSASGSLEHIEGQ